MFTRYFCPDTRGEVAGHILLVMYLLPILGFCTILLFYGLEIHQELICSVVESLYLLYGTALYLFWFRFAHHTGKMGSLVYLGMLLVWAVSTILFVWTAVEEREISPLSILITLLQPANLLVGGVEILTTLATGHHIFGYVGGHLLALDTVFVVGVSISYALGYLNAKVKK